MNTVAQHALAPDNSLPFEAANALLDGEAAPSRIQVLLVEDDDADAFLIRRALDGNARVGEVFLAKDGVEALEMIDSGAVKPDLAIVDLHMPRKDGFSFLLDLKVSGKRQFTSVVLTSSRSGADNLRSRKRGAEAYLTKPSSVEKLANVLDGVIAAI